MILGVDTIEIDMAMQKVTVTGIVDQKKILKTIRRTGRRAELWQIPYNPVLRNNNYTDPNYNYHQQYYGGPVTSFAAAAPLPSSSYNYYKHGYDDHNHQYAYYNYGHHGGGGSGPTIFGSKVGDAFSEESTQGCSIM